MSDANNNPMTELERMLAQNTQGTPEFRGQADKAAAVEAQRAIDQSRVKEQTLGGFPQRPQDKGRRS